MMNKNSLLTATVTTLGIAAFLCTAMSTAQGQGQGPGMHPLPGPPDWGDAMGPDAFGPPPLEMLDLDEAQEKAIKDILAKARSKATPIMARVKLKAAEIIYLWSIGKPDRDKILDKQREIANLLGQAMEIRTVMFLDLFDTLDPEQQQMLIPMVGRFLMSRAAGLEEGAHRFWKKRMTKNPLGVQDKARGTSK